MKEKLSPSLVRYLTAIYKVSVRKNKIRITDIADELEVSKPSANRAVGELKKLGLAEHMPYGAITLTDEGISLARKAEDGYSLLVSFFEDILGVDAETAKMQSADIEALMREDVLERIEEFMQSFEQKRQYSDEIKGRNKAQN